MIKGLQKMLPEEYHEEYALVCGEMKQMFPDMSDPKTAQNMLNNFLLFQLTITRKELKDAFILMSNPNKENTNEHQLDC